MKKERTLITLTCLTFILALLFSFMSFGFASETNGLDMSYNDTLFNDATVHSIELIADPVEWQTMLDNALYETYIPCDVVIDGVLVDQVGIRPKGNASLTNIALDDTTDRFSFKIKFDEYINGQNFYGLNALSLNNSYNDKSYMKEFVAYDLYELLGVPVPQVSYINVSLNGENLGLYLAVEPMEESYLINNFGTLEGQLFKPEVGDMADRFTGQGDANAYTGNTNLIDQGDTVEDYSYLFDNQVIGESHESNQAVMLDFLATIQSGQVDDNIDVESILKYTAVTAFTANFDSYLGKRANNYYLYENDGVVSLLPWDLNMAFGGLGVTDGEHAVNISVIEPYFTSADQYPMISSVLQNPEYRTLYESYLEEIVQYVNSGAYDSLILEKDALINDFVKMDATAFFDYSTYGPAVDALITFASDKAQAVTNQLSGDFTPVNTTFDLEDLTKNDKTGDRTTPDEAKQAPSRSADTVEDQSSKPSKGSGTETPSNTADKNGDSKAVETSGKGSGDQTNKGNVGDSQKQNADNSKAPATENNSTNQTVNATPIYFITSVLILISALVFALLYKRT